MARKDYTLEVYIKDRRTKKGERLLGKYEYKDVDFNWMNEELRELMSTVYPKEKYRLEIHATNVTRINAMSGETFEERYDTPYHCSPASEAFFSM